LAEVGVLWSAPLLEVHGYGEEARNFVLALAAAGVQVRTDELRWARHPRMPDLDPAVHAQLLQLARTPLPPRFVSVQHVMPPAFRRVPAAAVIGRTMFETDRIPAGWAEACKAMDEIWVPSTLNRETFVQSGVPSTKVHIVPGPINDALFAASHKPLRIEGQHGFTFLTIFDWTLRKGWDVLLRAYVEEFGPDEDVCLIMKVWSSRGETVQTLQEVALSHLTERLCVRPERVPDIIFLDVTLSEQDMLRLYASADAFVLVSRAEGYGRPYLEAMAMGLPTIGTNWGGNTDFMKPDNSYLVEVEDVLPVPPEGWLEIPQYQGHCWAQPSVRSLRAQMREVVTSYEAARRKGALAREYVLKHYSWAAAAHVVLERLSVLLGIDLRS